MLRLLLFALFLSASALPATLTYSRPARPWEFLDAVGQQASILGKEDGTLEAYVYPLKIFSNLQLSFEVGGKIIPASTIARRLSFSASSCSIVYTGDEFQVNETFIVPVHERGGII